jgi:chromosomal replication initiation ATPase DnaA
MLENKEIFLHSRLCAFEANQTGVGYRAIEHNILVDLVCDLCGTDTIQFYSSNRKRYNVMARLLAAVYLRHNTNYPFEKIGQLLGGKDHATVIHYMRSYKNLISIKDPELITKRNKLVTEIVIKGIEYKYYMP